MRVKILFACAALAALPLTACPKADDGSLDLKKALIAATTSAIRLEMSACEEKLKVAQGGLGPKENVEKYTAALVQLKKDQELFANMKSETYPAVNTRPVAAEDGPALFDKAVPTGPIVPALPKTIPIMVRQTYQTGSLLDVDGATKSGPFYRVAGIAGGCTCVLKSGQHYDLTVYLVYRREYFGLIQDYYVYVAGLGQ
jgi:hypothetical protein